MKSWLLQLRTDNLGPRTQAVLGQMVVNFHASSSRETGDLEILSYAERTEEMQGFLVWAQGVSDFRNQTVTSETD